MSPRRGHRGAHASLQPILPGPGPGKTNCGSVAFWQPGFDFCFNKGWEGEFEPCGYLHFKTFKHSLFTCLALCVLY